MSKDYVMICPETNEPFYGEETARNRLVDAMQACGIRHRPAYNARHTYATMLLMDGLNPVFVADQRTLTNGFGDRHATITPILCNLKSS